VALGQVTRVAAECGRDVHREVSRPVLVERPLGGGEGSWSKASFTSPPCERRACLGVGDRGCRHDVGVLHQPADRVALGLGHVQLHQAVSGPMSKIWQMFVWFSAAIAVAHV
jgi:hypothetical protein